jgi:hypothetical protein
MLGCLAMTKRLFQDVFADDFVKGDNIKATAYFEAYFPNCADLNLHAGAQVNRVRTRGARHS